MKMLVSTTSTQVCFFFLIFNAIHGCLGWLQSFPMTMWPFLVESVRSLDTAAGYLHYCKFSLNQLLLGLILVNSQPLATF